MSKFAKTARAIKDNWKVGVESLKTNGIKETYKAVRGFLRSDHPVAFVNDYESYITRVESGFTFDDDFKYKPLISVIVPVYNTLDKHLVPCIESVLNQNYPNFELCLSDDNSTWDNVKTTLKKYESNPKVKVVYRTENGHISRNTNSAIEVATGEFMALLDCDDVLRPNALYEIVRELNKNPELDFIYSDEDKIDDDGTYRHTPHYKQDWSPDSLMTHNYTCHFSAYRSSIVREIGGLRVGFEGSQDYDFVLRFTEKLDRSRICHIPKILYHWRVRAESTSGDVSAKPYIVEAARKSKEEALERRGLKADLEFVNIINQWRVNYIPSSGSMVSIIIPSKDNYDYLKRCIDSITTKTEYRNYQIVVVDNGSSEDNKARYEELVKSVGGVYIYEPCKFNFSYMCNLGAKNADGAYLLFLNDDIEIVNGNWLGRMLGHAEVPHAGAVGAKLLYPDSNKIQHCGVVNNCSGPVHAFIGMSDDPIYYFGRNILDYNWLAVTAACLIVSKEKFDEVGGFNETLAVAYNDVDLSFKLYEAGYYNVVRNDVVLIHHESISRGHDVMDEAKMKRLHEEQDYLYSMHPDLRFKDPFYNEGLDPYGVDFALNNLVRSSVKETQVSPSDSGTIMGCIDSVMKRFDGSVVIQGWGFEKGHAGEEVSLLLSGPRKYQLDTFALTRPDVKAAFPDEENSDKSGLQAYFNPIIMEIGSYKISIVTSSGKLDTDKVLEV